MYDLDLAAEKNEVLSNLLSDHDKDALLEIIDGLGVAGHTAIFSSGTSGGPMKGYLLSREALIKNALAVNQRLGLSPSDLWGASLPSYHIGGLSIFYRAKLLGHSPVDLRPWDPQVLALKIRKSGVTVLSLVPTQLYDLVSLNAKAPSGLRAVLLGGDFLSDQLEQSALNLGWPVVRTFGMSEVCSQLCTGKDESGFLRPLPIHTIRTSENGQLLVKSESLFSYKITKSDTGWSFTDAQSLKNEEGFLPLQDRVLLRNGNLLHQGRLDEGIKVSGHLIDLKSLKEILDGLMLEEKLWGEMELAVRPSSRSGASLVLHSTPKVPERVIQAYQERIAPVRVEVVSHQKGFIRTELGKFKDL